MDAETCIRERRSVRKFLDQPVPHEVFEKIVELARYAPSWKNSQVARYHVIEDAGLKSAIADNGVLGFGYNTKTIKGAPALVVLTVVEKVCGYEADGSFSTPKEDRWEMFDAGIAAQTFCLAAHLNGVGAVILGIFDENKIASMCNFPKNEKIAALICAGYPAEPKKAAPPRKEVDEILSFDQ